MKLTKYQLLTAGLLGLTTCSGAILASTLTFADNDTAVDQVQITVPTACEMTGSGHTSHTASLAPGIYSGNTTDYANGIGSTTLTVYCNDNNGFSIYAIGFTGDTAGNNDLVGANTSLTIPTALYTNGATTSSWSMKVTSGRDSGDTTSPNSLTIDNNFNNYHTVPDDTTGYTRIAHKATNTDMTIDTGGATVTTTYDAYIATNQPADTYTGQVKYVMVHPYSADPDPYKPTTAVYMQDVATWKNTLLPNIGDEIIATDARDNKQYYVAKLPDGNIWMTQNLDFEIGSATITSDNTDVPSNWSDTLTDTYATGTTTWNDSYAAPESYDPGDLCWNGILDEDYETTLSSGTISCSQHANHYHVGNYYNWTAAVAMQDSSSYSDSDDVSVEQSVCPAGWTLPMGGYTLTGTGSFYYLIDNRYAAGTEGDIHLSPVSLVYGGAWNGLSGDVSSSGYYWTSMAGYTLTFDAYGYIDYPSSVRNAGYSVRCLVR